MNAGALYVCYLAVGEPLVETQAIAYVRALARTGYRMHLLTFERRALPRPERRAIRDRLAADGIVWHALRYHRWPTLSATAYDIAAGGLYAAWLARRHRLRLVHGRSHVGAAIGLLARALAGTRMLFDMRGRLAEEYADAGHWPRTSLAYRLTSGAERALLRRADAVVVLTEAVRGDLVAGDATLAGRALHVVPCCVDLDRYPVEPAARAAERTARGFDGRTVFVYLGKLGTWYMEEELARFAAAARRRNPSAFLWVLSQSDPGALERALRGADLRTEHDYRIGFLPPAELPRALIAADAGLSFVRPTISKRSSSPTKVAEYLAAGLPVVSGRGIGDLDAALGGGDCAVLVSDFGSEALAQAAERVVSLVGRAGTAAKCRALARQRFSLDAVGGPAYLAVYRSLIGVPGAGGTA
jgi:glycosyltransferase involved in cell wall biosynthesis